MVIRIFKDASCVRYIEVEEESALSLFNMILQSLGDGESVVIYSGGDEQHVVATGC